MRSREEQLWSHIDSTLPAEERAALEQQMQADEQLQRDLELRRKLHDQLGKMEPEQPSMRFTQNLMELLPKLYQRIQIKPLVGKTWVRAYLSFFLLTVLALFGFGFGILTSSSSLIAIDWISNSFSVELETVFPFRFAIILMSVTTAVLYLMWLDKRLHGRFK